MHAKSSDVRASFTADPEDTEVTVIVELDQLALVDGSDTQLSLDGRNERRSLEQCAGQSFKGSCKLCFTTWELVMESDDSNVFLSGALLRLDQSGGSIDTYNQTSSNFGIQCTTVTSLLHPQHALDPSDNFMTGRVRWFVEVDDAG